MMSRMFDRKTISEIFIVGVVACFCLQAQGLSVDVSITQTVPSSRKYIAHGYPINNVPERDYDDPECSLIGSSVMAALDDYEKTSQGDGSFNKYKAMEKFSGCRIPICGSSELRKKLQIRPEIMEELNSVAISFGKTFNQELTDDEFPIVRPAAYSRQRNAVYDIITYVCGYQAPSIKASMTPRFVTEIFMRTLVPMYNRKVFAGEVYGYILNNATKTNLLEISWNTAASQRDTDHPCLDPELENADHHVTIEELQHHASTLHGVVCNIGNDDDYGGYYYAAMGAPPPSDSGTGGAAPTSNGPDMSGPPEWSPDNSFAP